MNFWTVVIIIACLVVLADKGITYINISLVKQNFPNVDYLSVEKNPVAKFLFTKFGLINGTLIYIIPSIILFILAVFLLASATGIFFPNNKFGSSLYIVMMYYGFVLTNNIYFMLKFAKIIN